MKDKLTALRDKIPETARYYLRIIGTLFVITAVVSVLLGAVNLVTAPSIAAHAEEKRQSSMVSVMPECDYGTENLYAGEDKSIVNLVDATQNGALKGYCVEVSTNGFGGTLQLMVGVDVEGKVTGVTILSHAETLKTDQHGWLVEQYAGHSGEIGVSKLAPDAQNIQAISGATVTSKAVTAGVNAALSAVAALGA